MPSTTSKSLVRPSLWPLQIASHPYNNSLVVLVHGIMSGPFRAWEDAVVMIQQIYDDGGDKPTFGSYDYRAFGYKSGYLLQPAIEDCFYRLEALVAEEKYDSVILVGHSQGGIVAKLFIIDQLLKGNGECLKVDAVITLDTPHLGPRWWLYPFVALGGVWKHVPLANKLPILRQLADLGRGSRNLKTLRTHWTEKHICSEPRAATPSRRYIRSYTISGPRFRLLRSKLVVSRRSAEGFAIDEPLEVPRVSATLFGTGHAVGAMKDYRHLIEQILSAHDEDSFRLVHGQLLSAESVLWQRELAPWCNSAILASEVGCWQRRAAEGFQRRPLRRLPMPEALKKFVAMRHSNP